MFARLLCAATLLAVFSPDAKAINITSCADITLPGSYVFTSNIMCAAGSLNPIPSLPSALVGILISTSDVTLDLSGWDLIGPGSVAGVSTYGIYAEGTFSNITIENGTVSGFLVGIELNGGTADLVTNVTIVNASTTVPEPGPITYMLTAAGFLLLALRRPGVNHKRSSPS